MDSIPQLSQDQLSAAAMEACVMRSVPTLSEDQLALEAFVRDSVPMLSEDRLNAAALEKFVYKPVDKKMIRYLATTASEVIHCDPNMMPPPAPASRPRHQAAQRPVHSSDGGLPSVEVFITQLVVSSNVQVPTLMSSLVYLRRLKSRLQPMAKGLRCTIHRIFLASLILAAKYLNDSSPKNKHWANYSVVSSAAYTFGFSRTEVNLMEKQLLHLLDWDLRITEEDLYRELDAFLAPIRDGIERRYVYCVVKKLEQEMRERKLHEERLARQREREEEARLWASLAQPQHAHTWPLGDVSMEHAAVASYAIPPASPGRRSASRSRSRAPTQTSSHSRGSSRDVSPPGLYSSASSYAGSTATSRATTPLSEADITTAAGPAEYAYYHHHHYPDQPYIYDEAPDAAAAAAAAAAMGSCDSPMDLVVYDEDQRPCVPEKDAIYAAAAVARGKKQRVTGRRRPHQQQQQLLPFEISAEDLKRLEEEADRGDEGHEAAGGRRVPARRGGMKDILGRVFAGVTSVR